MKKFLSIIFFVVIVNTAFTQIYEIADSVSVSTCECLDSIGVIPPQQEDRIELLKTCAEIGMKSYGERIADELYLDFLLEPELSVRFKALIKVGLHDDCPFYKDLQQQIIIDAMKESEE